MRARFRSDREQRNKQAWVSIRCHAGTLSKHTRRFHVDCATFQSAVMRARFRSLCGRPFPGPGRFQSAVMRARFRSASINDVQRLKGFNPLSCGHAFEANLANCCISRLRFNPLSCGHAFEADPFQTEVQELFFGKPAQGKAKGQMVAQPARVKTPDDGGKNRTSAICWRLAQGDPALWGGQRTSLRSSAAAGRARGAPAAWGPQGGDSQRGMPLWKALR